MDRRLSAQLYVESSDSQLRQIRSLGNLTLGQEAKTILCICDHNGNRLVMSNQKEELLLSQSSKRYNFPQNNDPRHLETDSSFSARKVDISRLGSGNEDFSLQKVIVGSGTKVFTCEDGNPVEPHQTKLMVGDLLRFLLNSKPMRTESNNGAILYESKLVPGKLEMVENVRRSIKLKDQKKFPSLLITERLSRSDEVLKLKNLRRCNIKPFKSTNKKGNEFRLTRAWRMDESGSNGANGTRILSRAYDFTPWLLNLAYTSFLASLGSVMTSFEKDLSVFEF
ncbi:hypothetical protein Tco_1213260 [Tanacetum coccineum]